MDLKIISDKDYSLLIAKYSEIKQVTKNTSEIIEFLCNSEKESQNYHCIKNYLIDSNH